MILPARLAVKVKYRIVPEADRDVSKQAISQTIIQALKRLKEAD
jgi:hypothetical protein